MSASAPISKTISKSIDPTKTLRPLQTQKYFRASETVAQTQWLLSLTPAEVLKLAHERVSGTEFLIKEEAIVYLLREYHTKGDKTNVGLLIQTLLSRIAPSLRRWTSFLRGYSETHCEQCIEETSNRVILDLLDMTGKNEFWELKFWLCLKRRLINLLGKYRKIAENELNPIVYSSESGAETNLIDQISNPDNPNTQRRLEAEEALSRLSTKIKEAAHLLYEEDWTQQEVADHFNVTDKTIRNWMTSARKTLQLYYGVEG